MTLTSTKCLIFLNSILTLAYAHFCGNNRIPYGIEIYRNGQPSLLCSRPSCFEKTYADCDERALRKSCESNTSWVGGFDKSYGNQQPLYVQCCEFETLPLLSEPLYSNVIIRPGEYFEGEEIMDKLGQEVLSFDLITNLKLIPGTQKNSTPSYQIDIRRFHCSEMVRPKRYKPWKWP
ncbi:warthog protein 5 [Ditylenchus destructor]|uniref:Warthog protein 5 n=1 Tax=Ditylenchus destructor TaxID=166010 RepID=A0AAD4N5I5_9BILA|nr:warthog protein 5 [Ditylenchus destructor]